MAKLIDNTSTIQELIDRVNGLPEAGGENLDTVISEQDSLISQIQTALQGKAAGGGGSVETCSVQIGGFSDPETSVYYVDLSGQLVTELADGGMVITVMKNSIVYHDGMQLQVRSGDATSLGNWGHKAIYVYGDCVASF